MRAKVFTLRFSPQLGRFDDAALVALQQKVVLEQVREHAVQIGDEVMLVCVATWREQSVQQPAAPRPAPSAQPATGGADQEIDAPSPSTSPLPDRANGPTRPVGELRAELGDEQRVLFDRLRAWRSRTAHDEGAPPYVILTNRQLVELVRQRPESKAGIGRIDGLGDKKIARHGDAILQVLWGSAAGDPAAPTAAAATAPALEGTAP